MASFDNAATAPSTASFENTAARSTGSVPARTTQVSPFAEAQTQALSGTAHLVYFTTVQMVVYFDRSLLAGFVVPMREEFLHGVPDQGFWTGMLASSFMGGFIIASPIMALMSGRAYTAKIMGCGLAVWCVAALMAACAPSYGWLLLARIAAGAGEAAYCSLAPPIIDDTAPANMKSVYLSVYFSTIFFGGALGFGLPASLDTWGEARFVFVLEALVMAPLVVFIFKFADQFHSGSCTSNEAEVAAASVELPVTGGQETLEMQSSTGQSALIGEIQTLPWWQQVMVVFQSRTYILVLMGYSASMFSLGGFGWWLQDYVQAILHASKRDAGLALGAMTAMSGIIGTVAGGFLLDHLTHRDEGAPESPASRSKADLGIRGRAAVRVAYKCSLMALPFVLLGMAARSTSWFYGSMAVGQLFVFMSTAPVNVAIMEAMPPNLRGLAMAITTTLTHLLGDVISPVFIGKVKDWCNDNLTFGMWILALWPAWSIFYWGWAAGDVDPPRVAQRVRRLSVERISQLRAPSLRAAAT